MASRPKITHDASKMDKMFQVGDMNALSINESTLLRTSLSDLGLKQEDIEFIIEHREKFLKRPKFLAMKLEISEGLADKVLKILKSSYQLTNEEIEKIKNCIKKHPDIDSHEDIALLCGVEEGLVTKYFEIQPLNDNQKVLVKELYNLGKSVGEISDISKAYLTKVTEYIESTFVTFSGEDGLEVLSIIHNLCGQIPISDLRQNVQAKNLKFQNQIFVLQHTNPREYEIVKKYFSRYEESQDFLNFDLNLTMDEILLIKLNCKDSVEQLSVKLNKIESAIYGYLHRYSVLPIEQKYYFELQEKQLSDYSKAFESKSFSLDSYRTIYTSPYDDIISNIKANGETESTVDLLIELSPLILYYIRCSLSLENISQLITDFSRISITTHDIFHIIFQLSDPVLKGLCIEHYSFSNPVPLYYPKLECPQNISTEVNFGICKELWYCLKQYNGLISFGLGRASWNAIGKSTLLDLIFETDFVKGSPQNSAFHHGSIDIQITKNYFGYTSHSESTKWAYIDCHSYSDLSVIQVMCSHLDVALIHVCYNDFKSNKAGLYEELSKFKLKHIYILVRDCECEEVTVEHKTRVNGTSETHVFIPDLTRKERKPSSLLKSLKKVGYDIIHLNIENPQLIQSKFIFNLLQDFDFLATKKIYSFYLLPLIHNK